jgi:hypothetical protein
MAGQRRKTQPKLRKILLNAKPSPFYLTAEAADYLRLEKNTLVNYRTNLTGPRFRRHGGKICYHEKDLEEWSEDHVGEVS